jgi:hypothetical protein
LKWVLGSVPPDADIPAVNPVRTCHRCGRIASRDEFPDLGKRGYRAVCKKCREHIDKGRRRQEEAKTRKSRDTPKPKHRKTRTKTSDAAGENLLRTSRPASTCTTCA